MNYLIDLTKEEIKYVCKVIPYQETVAYFTRYPKEFSKLRPGFRVKSLNEEMVTRILYEFRTRDFVSSFLIKHIDRWIKQIDEELTIAKEESLDQEAAYIDVLSRSHFAENVALYFKIREEEKSKDYLSVLASAVSFEVTKRKKMEQEMEATKKKMVELFSAQSELKKKNADIQKQAEGQKKSEKELRERLRQSEIALEEERERSRQTSERADGLEADLYKAKEDEVWKTSEMQQKIDALTQRIEEQSNQSEEYRVTFSELESKLTSVEEEVKTWKNQLRNREKQLFTYKAERATLLTDRDADKKLIKELKEALEQALSAEKTYKEQLASMQSEITSQQTGMIIRETIEEQESIEIVAEDISKKFSESERCIPLMPEDMDDFDEYFEYNLENIGFDSTVDGSIDFLYYLERILFDGVPLLIKRGLGINLANALSNTLYGVPVAARLLYSEDADIRKVDEFLSIIPDRVVCIDGFIGNCNVMELIPVLEQHRNKIIVLTYMFNRTLTFVPNEILSYVHFISADEFCTLLKIKDITEEPSEIKEVPMAYKGSKKPDMRFQKIFRDIACECGIGASTASAMAESIEDENYLNQLLMFTLLPYVQLVLGKNPYNCSKRLQRYAGEAGRCLKKEILTRWFG